MNWKARLQTGNSEQMSNGVIDVVGTQGDVSYPQEIQGLLTVTLYTSAPATADEEFIDRVVVASLLETGYDEIEEFRCFDASADADEPSPWTQTTLDWEFDETDKAVQVAKQRGTVPYGTRVFGTIRTVISAEVPWNWSPEEKKLTCIGRLLRDGPDQILGVSWTEQPEPPPA